MSDKSKYSHVETPLKSYMIVQHTLNHSRTCLTFKTCRFSVVITSTMSSHVSSITESSLSPSTFDNCVQTASTASTWLSTEISLFDLVDMNGWSQGDSYHVVNIDSGSQRTIITSTLSSGLEYDIHTVCLEVGNYVVELILNSNRNDPGYLHVVACDCESSRIDLKYI